MENEYKYIITAWRKEFDYDGLSSDFKILGEFAKPSEGVNFLCRQIMQVAQKHLEQYPNWYFMDVDWKTRPTMNDPNKHNEIVFSSVLKVGDGTGYNSAYFYLDLIKIQKDRRIGPELFGSEKCRFEIDRYFREIEKESPKNESPADGIPRTEPDFSLAIMSPSGLLNPAMHVKNQKPRS